MVSIETFRQIALSFPETTEEPHFEKPAFKVAKKIFATMNLVEFRATVKLSESDQDLFCLFDKKIIYPVPNKWGKQGWTQINLIIATEEMYRAALTAAYCEVAPSKLSFLIKSQNGFL
jgi:predicted DNA-binding protein (MmcQ/YjbR family)